MEMDSRDARDDRSDRARELIRKYHYDLEFHNKLNIKLLELVDFAYGVQLPHEEQIDAYLRASRERLQNQRNSLNPGVDSHE